LSADGRYLLGTDSTKARSEPADRKSSSTVRPPRQPMAVTMTSDPCPRSCPSDCPAHRLGDLRVRTRAPYFVSSRPPVHHQVPEHPLCRRGQMIRGKLEGNLVVHTGARDSPMRRQRARPCQVYECRHPGPAAMGPAAGGPPASRSPSRTRGVITRGRSTGMSCRLSGRSRWPLLTPTCSTRSMPSRGTAVTIATTSGTCGSPDSVDAWVRRALPAAYLRGAPGIDDPADPISS
jgi:hypothetical protein